MNRTTFTPERSEAMRAAIVQHVEVQTAAGSRRPNRILSMVATTGAGLLVLGGGLTAASATGLWDWPFGVDDPMPGGDTVVVLPADALERDGDELPAAGVLLDQEGAGSTEVLLPVPPSEATHVSVQITCLSAGNISFGTDPVNNPGIVCTQADVPTTTWYDFPVSGGETIYLITAADVQWRVAAVYVARAVTEWGVNANGQTFGVANDSGEPDLIAVQTSEGRDGYVFAEELAEANGTAAAEEFESPEDALRWQEERQGKTISVPVYLSDGETVIGEFIIQGP